VSVANAPTRLSPLAYPVYHYFRKWCIDGTWTWERINRAIRERRLRVRLKRDPKPSAGIVDSQSVKDHWGRRRRARGYELGAKKIDGRKRHLLVDTLKDSYSQSL
jgi:putative transposase